MSETLTAETNNQVTASVPEVSGASEQGIVREDLKANGWSAKEIELAEKRGFIKKKETPDNKAEVNTNAETKPETQASENKPEVKQEKKSSLPEFSFKTPEQEKAWLDAFGPGTEQRAMYFRMKNERQQRQAAEKERDRMIAEFQSIKAEMESLRNGRGVQQEVDEQGNVIDPEDKPLTLKQWKELQRQEAEEREKIERSQYDENAQRAEAIQTQEEYARQVYPDFDEALGLAADIKSRLDDIGFSPWERSKAIELLNILHYKGKNSTQYGVEDYNAAMVAYELGRLHPSYGKSKPNGHRSETNSNGTLDPNKANGSLTPEQMKRAEQNTQRRVSSASIPGGGVSRTISADDVTLNDILKMSPAQRDSFRKKNPERWAEIRRG